MRRPSSPWRLPREQWDGRQSRLCPHGTMWEQRERKESLLSVFIYTAGCNKGRYILR